MKTVGQLRKQNAIQLTQKTDSLYKPIERTARKFTGPKVPKKLAADLPFKSKQKNMTKAGKQSYASKRAVVVEGEEKRKLQFMKVINSTCYSIQQFSGGSLAGFRHGS